MGTQASWDSIMDFLFRISGIFTNNTSPYHIHAEHTFTNVLTNNTEYSEFVVCYQTMLGRSEQRGQNQPSEGGDMVKCKAQAE